MRVRLAPTALGDLHRLNDFLSDASPEAARRMIATINAAIERLAALPESGRPVDGARGLREVIVPFGRSAYLLRYGWTPADDELVIVRIRHGREIA